MWNIIVQIYQIHHIQLSENINVSYNTYEKYKIRGELMGKPVDYNLFPAYQNTLEDRLNERKEEFMEELEKAKIGGYLLDFDKIAEEIPQ